MTTWLFRPFVRIAGMPALVAGVAVVAATAVIGWSWRGVFTDGVLDLHVGPAAPLAVFFAHGFIAWLSMSACALITGHALTSTKYRLVDLLGTQALARWPLLPAVAVVGMPSWRQSLQTAIANLSGGNPPTNDDVLTVLLLSIVPLVAVGWAVWLMFHAYALVFNLKGARAAVSFIAAVVAAEIASKVLIVWIQFGFGNS